MWEKIFPIIKNMHNHYDNAIEIITATAVLHNLSVLWNEELPDDDDDGEEEDGDSLQDDPQPPIGGGGGVGGADRAARTRIRLEGSARQLADRISVPGKLEQIFSQQ